MLVSVVVCTYGRDIRQNLMDAVTSLLNQTYQDIEIIVVVDGDEALSEKVATIYGTQDKIQVVSLGKNLGVSAARNLGVSQARGDIIAFIDDDAVADKRWIENLTDTYQKNDAIAVGGAVLPIWFPEKPDHLPEELYWLVGLTHDGYLKEGVTEVRNVYGPNMSFKREVFEKVGLFDETFGFSRQGASCIQGDEAEFSLRVKSKLGRGVIYNPNLVVYHKVPTGKTGLRVLLKRSFYQGYSKALLAKLSPYHNPLITEKSYLKDLLLKYIPRRIKLVFQWINPRAEIKRVLLLLLTIIAVGLGFVCGQLKARSIKGALPE